MDNHNSEHTANPRVCVLNNYTSVNGWVFDNEELDPDKVCRLSLAPHDCYFEWRRGEGGCANNGFQLCFWAYHEEDKNPKSNPPDVVAARDNIGQVMQYIIQNARPPEYFSRVDDDE